MPFKFWGGNDAETEFREDVMTVHANSGYTGCYPASKVSAAWDELRVWSKASPTAVTLFNFIDTSEKEIHVVGMSGGFQCFGSTQGLDHKKGVIFVDLDAKLQILASTEHNLHLPLDAMARIWSGSLGGKTRVDLDNRITLLHEIGHSRQWIERPGWFDDDYRTATKKGIGENARSLKDILSKEIRDKAKTIHLRTAVNTYESSRSADLTFLPNAEEGVGESKLGQKLERPVGWGVPIEHDNMRRHEWKICREMGLPLRSNYGDISDGGSTKNRQLTSMMKTWAAEEEAEKIKANAARIGNTGASAGQIFACEKCGTVFAKKALMMSHKFNCKAA